MTGTGGSRAGTPQKSFAGTRGFGKILFLRNNAMDRPFRIRFRKYALFWKLAAATFFVDQLTKLLVIALLPPMMREMPGYDPASTPIAVVPGFFNLVHVGNFGAAWGLLSGQKIFLTLFALAALAAIFKFRRQLELERRPVQLAFGLLVGGIFGNLLDRLWHGYVVDFLDFTLPLIGYRWPAFNAADCGIVVGVGIFLVLNTLPLFGYNHPEAKRFNEEDALK